MTRVEHSRRFLRELDKAPGGNNLQYIYYSVLVFLLLVTKGLNNETALGGNGVHLEQWG